MPLLARAVVVLSAACVGALAGAFAGYQAWSQKLFGQDRSDMVGGFNMIFDVLLGGIGGLAVAFALGVVVTRRWRKPMP